MTIAALVRRSRLAAVVCVALLGGFAEGRAQETNRIWTVPDIGALPDNATSRRIRRGRDLITATYAHIGPQVADRSKRSEEHTSELQSLRHLVCRLLLEKKKI